MRNKLYNIFYIANAAKFIDPNLESPLKKVKIAPLQQFIQLFQAVEFSD